jgi:hypothetical protein
VRDAGQQRQAEGAAERAAQCAAKGKSPRAPQQGTRSFNEGAVKGVMWLHTSVPMWTLRAEEWDQVQVRVGGRLLGLKTNVK